MRLTRRSFLKLAAAGAGALAVATGVSPALRKAARAGAITTVPSVCHMCLWKCSILVRVRDGQVVKIEGHPGNPSSRGKTCARGQAGVMELYDPDRLRQPLIRAGERGDGKYRPATWKEALDVAAAGLKRVAAQHGGPEAVAFVAHNGGEFWFAEHLPGAWGSPNAGKPNEGICITPRERAAVLTYGRAVGGHEPVDWDAVEYVVLLGNHIGENAHVTHMSGLMGARARGAGLVVVDPRLSTAAAKADHWLAIRPGTDAALLLAWIHVLITENLYDQEYVDRWTTGFLQLARHVKPFTPQWAEGITDIPASMIRKVAREMAARAPRAVVAPGRHTTWYGNDTQRLRAQFILNALLGAVGRPGGLYFPSSCYYEKFPYPPLALEPDTGG